MTANPKGTSDRTFAALQLGTDAVKILALLKTYSRQEIIDVLPHLASTGFTGEQFTALRSAVQAHLDSDLVKVGEDQIRAVNRLNRSTTILSVIAIVCTVILGVVSVATSCTAH